MRLNGGTFATPNAGFFKAAPMHSIWMETKVTPYTEWLDGTGTVLDASTDKDAHIETHSGVLGLQNYTILAQIENRYAPDENVVWSSSDPSVATVDPNGIVQQVADGSARIYAAISTRTITHPLDFAVTTSASTTHFVDWVSGSLADHCSKSIDDRLAGKSPITSLNVYSVQNHDDAVYVRNPNLWCADLVTNLTCISPWNSVGGYRRAGVLITRRHVLAAAHYPLVANSLIRFVDALGVVYTRTILKVKKHPDFSSFSPDVLIGVLDSDLPSSIASCYLAPPQLPSYLPQVKYRIPLLGTDQEEKITVRDLLSLPGSDSHSGFSNNGTFDSSFIEPIADGRKSFYERIVGGDSGNPVFLVVNDELVLMSVFTDPIGGSDMGHYTPDINQLIADVDALAGNGGTGYTVTHPDLSGFPTY